MNTLDSYTEGIVNEHFQMGFWDTFFPKRYWKRKEDLKKALYEKFENVAKSYHGIAVQNYEALLLGECQDDKLKFTRKVGRVEIKNCKPTFKP